MSKDYHSLHLTNEKTDLESASVKFKINAFLFCYMKYFTEGPRDLCACVLSCFSCLQLFVTLWTVAHQAPLWDSPGKNTGVGCHFLLQGIFLTRDRSHVPCISYTGTQILTSPALAGGFFTTSATWVDLPDKATCMKSSS